MTHVKTNVVGIDVEYALMDITFDQELYIYQTVACPNHTCPSPPAVDCTCDYTDPNACPKTTSGDSSCPKCPVNNPFGVSLCDFDTQPWVTITADEIIDFSNITDPVFIRYKANTKYCEGLKLYISQSQGNVEAQWSTDGDFGVFTRWMGYETTSIINSINVCPTDNDYYLYNPSWTNNTYFMRLIPSRPPAYFSVHIVSATVPKLDTSGALPRCTNLTSTHRCINDGEQIKGEFPTRNDIHFFTYIVDRPQILTISCPWLQQALEVYISLTKDNMFPRNSSADYFPDYPYDKELTLTMGPHDDGTPQVMYISFVPFYPTNYSCVLTTTPTRWKRSITDNPATAGSFLLMGTAELFDMNGTRYQSPNWAKANPFSVLFPRQHINPLWPVPVTVGTSNNLFININFFGGMVFDEASNPAKNRSFQAAFLLSYSDYHETSVQGNIQDIAQSYMIFKNMLVDIYGETVKGPVSFTFVNTTCDYTAYQTVLDEIKATEEEIFASRDYTEMTTLRYTLDIFTLRDGWYACYSQANDLLSTDTVNMTIQSTKCRYELDDPRWARDPCCNKTNRFYQCCVPREITVEVQSYVGVRNNEVRDKCASYDCTSSVLDEYQHTVGSLNNGECSISPNDYKAIQTTFALVFRSCWSKVYDFVDCDNDSQCSGYQCNMYTRTCEPPIAKQDLDYIGCIVNNSLPSTIYFLKYSLGLQRIKDNQELVRNIYDMFLDDDCLSASGLSYRSYYNYASNMVDTQVYYPSPRCYDQYCVIEHDFGYDGVFGGYRFYQYFWNETECAANSICQSAQCDSEAPGCISTCDTSPFCGYCTNNHSLCHNFYEMITTESKCNTSSNMCLLPNGNYIPDISDEDCTTIEGTCTQDCGLECTGPYTGCVAASVMNITACKALSNGAWHNDSMFCATSDSKTKCQQLGPGYTWINCSTMSTSECFARVGPFIKNIGNNPDYVNMCQVTPIKCLTRQECEDHGGQCSDSYFFDPTNVYVYPQGLGKCVHGHFNYFDNMPQPHCNVNEHDSPMGCYTLRPSVFNQTECEAVPGDKRIWWTQARNKAECLAPMGCLVDDLGDLSNVFEFRFNEMNESLCNECNNNFTNRWTNKFKWTPGRWLPGVPKKPQWINGSVIVSTTAWQPAFNLSSFSVSFGYAFYGYMVDLLRSSAMCRMERLQNNIQSISCSCSGPGGKECFESSALMLGSTSACAQQTSTFTFGHGHLIFHPESVFISCVNVIVSQMSRQLFKATPHMSLSSNFVSYKKPDDYGITNRNGAVVGSILGDGIRLQARGISSLTVCLTGGNPTRDFTVYDFAEQDEDFPEILRPLNVTNMMLAANPGGPTLPPLICANISLSPSYNWSLLISHEPTFFPIIRVANHDWQSNKKQVFDQTATRLLYALGALFGLCALWGLFQLCVILYDRFRTNQPRVSFRLVHLLILTITMFITIRSIYFLILPSGKLADSQLADYVMVVLPTFIYFTAFTVIIVIWYIIASSQFHISFISRFKLLIGIINLVLYMIFVIIVLIFNFSQRVLDNDCGARRVVEMSRTTPQRIVSIFYAAAQAAISLVIGAAFIYLGVSIHMLMRFRMKSDLAGEAKYAQHSIKITVVTLCCSIGFILHCAFVLVLVAAEPSNVIFSFIGLIITEIIPTISILYAYNQGVGVIKLWPGSGSSKSDQSGNKLKRPRRSKRSTSETTLSISTANPSLSTANPQSSNNIQ
ncbi:hypothetical protein SAMD00019534_019920 [Acytostelium subglobosum LB1]|uniref:hypothetical protein n=1 Tax=Acytostelium subglobosum LB1 TaxID=1410327 RepID=UPI000644A7FF|nr:hypothetical protein SAMD00019534_019920 [Acytostelium subglobosum LB1]GAM18817.1 hypothetical protein SAMD00019534_019920 [Acytostelium subglobosum LB1]|eukprot:XP_012758037.1 hypothetical protein SAMD00019534_019920 [Acytostelium subglobosum LB1]